MTINNIQQTYFSETQATSSDQAVPASVLLAVQTLEMIQKAKHAVVESAHNNVGASSAPAVGSKKTEGAGDAAAIEAAYEKLLNLLKKAASTPDLNLYLLLLNYVAGLPDGVLNSPEIQGLLNEYKGAFQQMATALAQYESLDNDTDGGAQWLKDAIAKFSKIPVIGDTFTTFLANLPQFIAETTVTIDGQTIRVWRNNEDGTGADGAYFPFKHYKNLIALLLATGQKPGASIVPNPMYDLMASLSKEYMEHFIEKIKAATSAGQAFMILMSMFDDDYTGQEGSLAGSTDALTDLTNGTASPLLALVQDTKSFNDPAGFANAILLAKEVVASSPQFSSISGSLSDAIEGIKALPTSTDGGKTETTLGALLDAYTKDASTQNFNLLAAGMRALASPAQSLINNVQQIGALFTGLSKQVSTHLSIVTNQDDSVIKMGNSAGSSKEAYQQMMSSFVHNQKPN